MNNIEICESDTIRNEWNRSKLCKTCIHTGTCMLDRNLFGNPLGDLRVIIEDKPTCDAYEKCDPTLNK